MKKVSSRFGVSRRSRRSHSESRRKIAFSIFSGLITAAIPVGSVTPASAAPTADSITGCEIFELNGMPVFSNDLLLIPGDLGASWSAKVRFSRDTYSPNPATAWGTSTDPLIPLDRLITANIGPGAFRPEGGTFRETAYSVSFYASDDTSNPTGSPLCRINVPAAVGYGGGGGGGGDDGGGDSGDSWDIDLSNYLTRTESSLPNTL